MDNRLLIGVYLVLIIILVAVAVYTHNPNSPRVINTTNSAAEDIYLAQTLTPNNQAPGTIFGYITSKSGKSYNNITLIATGYTANDQTIGDAEIFLSHMDNKHYNSTPFYADFPDKSKTLDHITIQVLNATPA